MKYSKAKLILELEALKIEVDGIQELILQRNWEKFQAWREGNFNALVIEFNTYVQDVNLLTYEEYIGNGIPQNPTYGRNPPKPPALSDFSRYHQAIDHELHRIKIMATDKDNNIEVKTRDRDPFLTTISVIKNNLNDQRAILRLPLE